MLMMQHYFTPVGNFNKIVDQFTSPVCNYNRSKDFIICLFAFKQLFTCLLLLDMIEHKKKRPRWNQYNEVMEVILEERKKFNVKESNGLSYHHRPVER